MILFTLRMWTSQREFKKYYLVVQYRKFHQALQMQIHHRHLGHIVHCFVELPYCLKNKWSWLRIFGDPRDGSTNISDKFVTYGPQGTKGLNCYGDKMVVIPRGISIDGKLIILSPSCCLYQLHWTLWKCSFRNDFAVNSNQAILVQNNKKWIRVDFNHEGHKLLCCGQWWSFKWLLCSFSNQILLSTSCGM